MALFPFLFYASLFKLAVSNTDIANFLPWENISKKNFWKSSKIERSRRKVKIMWFLLLWGYFGKLLNKVHFFNNKPNFFIKEKILTMIGLYNKIFVLRSWDQYFMLLWLRVILQNFDAVLSGRFSIFFKNSNAGCFLMPKGLLHVC